jgi:hypothetical protein
MIQDTQIAKQALELIEKAHKLLMESNELVRIHCSDEEYKAYQSGIAHTDGRLFFLLMEPLYREHPSLAPPDTPPEFASAWANNKSPGRPKPGSK